MKIGCLSWLFSSSLNRCLGILSPRIHPLCVLEANWIPIPFQTWRGRTFDEEIPSVWWNEIKMSGRISRAACSAPSKWLLIWSERIRFCSRSPFIASRRRRRANSKIIINLIIHCEVFEICESFRGGRETHFSCDAGSIQIDDAWQAPADIAEQKRDDFLIFAQLRRNKRTFRVRAWVNGLWRVQTLKCLSTARACPCSWIMN